MLVNFLSQIDPERSVLVTLDQSVKAAQLQSQPDFGAVAGPDIAISFRDTGDLLKALCCMDGRAKSILLLSPTTPRDVTDILLKHSGAAKVYGDSDAAETRLSLDTLKSDSAKWAARESASPTQWLLATSGTTSTPKLVAHTLESLTRTARISETPSAFNWGQLYDSYRFAGLQVLLQAIVGQSLLIAPKVCMPLNDKVALFAKYEVNALSGTPTLWRKIIMSPEAGDLKLRSITLGGEIADQTILGAIINKYPTAKVRHIYASTEAGAGFSVTDGKAGFPLDFVTDGVNGVRLKIEEDILFIENRFVSGGYVGEDRQFTDSDQFVNTGDRVSIEDGRVYFLGRLTGVINVGGDKVSPENVEIILNAVDGVALSKAWGKRSPVMGQVVVADILLEDGADPKTTQRTLIKTCIERLAPYQRPVAYRIVKEIAVSENGKVIRS